MEYYDKSDYLAHYGVLGMKWGVRRYRDENGRLTAAGKKHYAREIAKGGFKKDRLDTMAYFDNQPTFSTWARMIERALRRDTTRAKKEGITERALETARYEVAVERVQSRSAALAVAASATLVGTAALAAMAPILTMPVASLGAATVATEGGTTSAILGKNVLYYRKESDTYKPRR